MLPLLDCDSDGELENVALGVNVGGGVMVAVALGLTVDVALVDCETLTEAEGDTLAEREDDVVPELLWLVETDAVGMTLRLIEREVDEEPDSLWVSEVDALWLVDAVPLEDTVVLCVTE